MATFNLDAYEPVDERLSRWWKDHPDGRTDSWIERLDDKQIICGAAIYRHRDDTNPTAKGFAHEVAGSSPVNRTSWIENCETSAIGRALANAGYSPKGARPSREEMAKVAASTPPPAPVVDADGFVQVGADGVQREDSGNGVAWSLSFGKHKGQPITTVPSEYLSWLVKQPAKNPKYADQHAETVARIEAELARRDG